MKDNLKQQKFAINYLSYVFPKQFYTFFRMQKYKKLFKIAAEKQIRKIQKASFSKEIFILKKLRKLKKYKFAIKQTRLEKANKLLEIQKNLSLSQQQLLEKCKEQKLMQQGQYQSIIVTL